MSQRRRRTIISRHFYARFHAEFMWRSAEDMAWDNLAPVGREFGSPDYDRQMLEDLDNKAGVYTPSLGKLKKK